MKKYSLLLLLALLLAACGSPRPQNGVHVTVSIAPLHYVAKQLAGDRINVSTLTPDGSGPETYQPTPAQIAELSESDAYVRVGTLGFEETRLRKVTQNMPHLFAVNASRGIKSLHGEGSEDPHTWTSPRSMRIIARNMAAAFCSIDTAAATRYTAALRAFEQHLDSLDAEVTRLTAELPCRTFLINHPALGYLARDYGLTQLAIEHDGKEASAERIAMLSRRCKEEGVRCVFVLRGHHPGAAESIAREIGARVVVINPLGYEWEEELLRTVKALRP